MYEIFKMEKGSRLIVAQDTLSSGAWINMENPNDKEVEEIAALTSIPEEMLKAPLDEEERARIEVDDNCTLFLFDTPIINEETSGYVYSTIPFAVIQSEGYFVTVCLRKATIVSDILRGRVRNFDINKRTRFLLHLLYANAIQFLYCLKQIDKLSNKIQQILHKSMKNKELIQLLDLEKALVYFSTSLNSNQLVIDKISASTIVEHFAEDTDLLDDVVIENRQAIEMATIYRDILSGTMDAFASVISNNQNTVMKLLTAITICLTIPSVIASIWGMNVSVPFENLPYAFYIILGIVVAIVVPLIIIMIKKKMF